MIMYSVTDMQSYTNALQIYNNILSSIAFVSIKFFPLCKVPHKLSKILNQSSLLYCFRKYHIFPFKFIIRGRLRIFFSGLLVYFNKQLSIEQKEEYLYM